MPVSMSLILLLFAQFCDFCWQPSLVEFNFAQSLDFKYTWKCTPSSVQCTDLSSVKPISWISHQWIEDNRTLWQTQTQRLEKSKILHWGCYSMLYHSGELGTGTYLHFSIFADQSLASHFCSCSTLSTPQPSIIRQSPHLNQSLSQMQSSLCSLVRLMISFSS